MVALVTGHLQVRTLDLTQEGPFGQRLAAMDGDRRFLSLLTARVKDADLVFAVTDPDTLLWPAARRTAAEWEVLRGRVQAQEPDALHVLADFLAVLQDVDRYSPDITWMRGLAAFLGAAGAEPTADRRAYWEEARGEGPFPLLVQKAGTPTVQPVYFPTFAPQWGTNIRRLTTLRFARPAAPGQPYQAKNQRGMPAFTISTAQSADGAAEALRGAGLVREVPGHVEAWPPWTQTTMHEEDGLFNALKGVVYTTGLTATAAVQEPYAWPDPVRILVHLLGPAGLPMDRRQGGLVFGSTAIARALSTGIRLPDASTLQAERAFLYKNHLVWLEDDRLGVTELRELGQVLWETFLGHVTPGTHKGDPTLEAGGEPLLRIPRDGRPVVQSFLDDATLAEVRKRAATLQRFARAWDLRGAPPTAGSNLSDLFKAAAHAWVRWATGAAPFPNGPRSDRTLEWSLEPGQAVRLPLDVE